jgi:hypothetical protein
MAELFSLTLGADWFRVEPMMTQAIRLPYFLAPLTAGSTARNELVRKWQKITAPLMRIAKSRVKATLKPKFFNISKRNFPKPTRKIDETNPSHFSICSLHPPKGRPVPAKSRMRLRFQRTAALR